jgi:hypothetical protein
LGLCKYFRTYIQGYAKLARPLTDFLQGLYKQQRAGKSFRWLKLSDEKKTEIAAAFQSKWASTCSEAFAGLKSALQSALVLAMPDFDQKFEVVADAYQTPSAIGAVLLQGGRPCNYLSRELHAAELNYSVPILRCSLLFMPSRSGAAIYMVKVLRLLLTISPTHIWMNTILFMYRKDVNAGWRLQPPLSMTGNIVQGA